MFFTAIQQLALFAQRVRSFTAIEANDQQILLRGAVLEMCFIWSGYLYDSRHRSWPDRKLVRHQPYNSQFNSSSSAAASASAHQEQGANRASNVSPAHFLSAEDLRPLIRSDLFEKHMAFVRSIKELDVDEASIMLLSVIVLLTPDRPGLSDSQAVSAEQERYLVLLRNYMNWRFGESAAAHIYPKLLLKLPDLRELAEALTNYQLLLCREEIEKVHCRLSNLKLDSSPSRSESSVWSLQKDVVGSGRSGRSGGTSESSCSSSRSQFCPETDEQSTSSECSERYLQSD